VQLVKKMINNEKISVRADIQVLRGLAVFSVLLYHAKIEFIASGYLGVDVFFVISGFLITGLIKRGIIENKFSIIDFYVRRAKRLLPAGYIVILLTIFFSSFLVTGDVLKDLIEQVIGAVTMTANFVLWKQSGYFSGTAELKPLLHMWSLSIEEQYYIIIPMVMLCTNRKLWIYIISVMFVISLFLCLYMKGHDGTFYLLPTRGWELLIGSFASLLSIKIKNINLSKGISYFAFAIICLCLIAPSFAYHPGGRAIIVCISTLAILVSNCNGFDGFTFKPLVKLGDLSYSLYLVHWPVFALYNNIFVGEFGKNVHLDIKLYLIVFSLAIGFVLYRYIEVPCRQFKILPIRVFQLSILGLLVILFSTAFVYYLNNNSINNYISIKRSNVGMGSDCVVSGKFKVNSLCILEDKPEIIFWGDSFAMHLVHGYKNEYPNIKIQQATSPNCGPLLNISILQEQAGRNYDWALNCIEFNESVLNYIKNTPSIKSVVISSPFDYYLKKGNEFIEKNSDGRYEKITANRDIAIKSLDNTINSIISAGKKVYVFTPPPSSGFDIGRCLERYQRGLFSIDMNNKCSITYSAYKEFQKPVIDFLSLLQTNQNLNIVNLDKLLCDGEKCVTTIDEKLLYRDSGHLSYEGSSVIFHLFGGTSLGSASLKP
jgi:peptidoglycan/LPS O-acetylase OafA/YrhL